MFESFFLKLTWWNILFEIILPLICAVYWWQSNGGWRSRRHQKSYEQCIEKVSTTPIQARSKSYIFVLSSSSIWTCWILNFCFDFFNCTCLKKTITNIRDLTHINQWAINDIRGHSIGIFDRLSPSFCPSSFWTTPAQCVDLKLSK